MSPIQIFISYSHEDNQWFKDGSLVPNLIKALEFDGDIRVWYDKRALIGGDPWQEEIEAAIDRAHITILLVSRSFITSTFIRNVELPRIDARAMNKELIIIPILVGYCNWQSIASLSMPQMLPGGPTPLVEFLNDPAKWDKVQFDILNQVEQQIAKVRARRKQAEEPREPIKPPEIRVAPTIPPALPTVEAAIPPRIEVEPAKPEPSVESTLPPPQMQIARSFAWPTKWNAKTTGGSVVAVGLLLLLLLGGRAIWNSTRAGSSSFTEDLGKGVKLEVIAIPGGTFQMGSNESENEKPIHSVTVAPFAMGKYEVTQAQWQAVMGNNPSNFKGDDLPVETVSWKEAQEFCQKLSQRTGQSYRLPTEAEWEMACRAGTTGAYAGNLDEMGWYDKNSGNKMHPVGQKKPNAFGLYDLHGNVWEWCEDVWHENYNGAPKDGSAWTDGGNSNNRLLRGGGGGYLSFCCRSALRLSDAPDVRYSNVGFRVVVAARTK